LRGHNNFPGTYDDIPLPRQTCTQRTKATIKAARQEHQRGVLEQRFTALKGNEMDRLVSCIALLLLIIAAAIGTAIVGYQCLVWLHFGVWKSMPLELLLGSIRSFPLSWVGLQLVLDWILTLPLVIFFYALVIFVFWLGGITSAALYKRAARVQAKMVTPAQTRT
jgi:hypothetical protein